MTTLQKKTEEFLTLLKSNSALFPEICLGIKDFVSWHLNPDTHGIKPLGCENIESLLTCLSRLCKSVFFGSAVLHHFVHVFKATKKIKPTTATSEKPGYF